jgi:hypothetical protein
VEVTRFSLTGGTERVQLELGLPRGEAPVRFVGGARTIRVERPAAVPVRLTVVGGSGSVLLDGTRLGEKGGKSVIESRGWSSAKNRFDVEIVGGSKSIEVVARPA